MAVTPFQVDVPPPPYVGNDPEADPPPLLSPPTDDHLTAGGRKTVSETTRAVADEEGKMIIGQLSKLRYEMVTNKAVELLEGTAPDVTQWNQHLRNYREKHGVEPLWFDSPWLYVECFMYRKIGGLFAESEYFKGFDPFRDLKRDALITSMKAVEVIAAYTENLKQMNENMDKNWRERVFKQFLELSLWGNKCDLSISCGNQNSQLSSSPLADLDKFRPYFLDNDIDAVWKFISSLPSNERLVFDVVLDNAGFEFVTDLCFLEVLYTMKILNKDNSLVRWYVKSYPWFVSDVTTPDFNWVLSYLATYNGSEAVSSLGKKWEAMVDSGQWAIQEETYWTLPNDFHDMKTVDHALYQKLSDAHFILFKGDLNYRKLTGDLRWDSRVPFERALRGFLPSTLCTLRTVKCDVVVGLKDATLTQGLPEKWYTSGSYALIQMACKRQGERPQK